MSKYYRLPSSCPYPLRNEIVEIILEYEGISNQCSHYLGVDHQVDKCKTKKPGAKEDHATTQV
jgi:hypothetical protein